MFGNRMSYFSLIIFLLVVFLMPVEVSARGGSLKGLGTLFEMSGLQISDTIIFVIIIGIIAALFIGAFIIWRFYYKKSSDAKELSKEIEKYDPAWNFKELEKHVIDTFYKIYRARTERNHTIMAGYTTPSLYNTYKSQIDMLITQHYNHHFKRVYLDKVKIMGIQDYRDDNKDAFWAYIKGSAFSYYTHYHTGSLISGNSKKRSHFREMWRFIRTSHGWLLDRRDPYVIWSLLEAESFTEGYKSLDNGYMYCGNCEGYYALEEGESPEQFDVCQCGGTLTYFEGVDEIFKKNR